MKSLKVYLDGMLVFTNPIQRLRDFRTMYYTETHRNLRAEAVDHVPKPRDLIP